MFWHPKPLEDVEGHHVHPEESVQEEELKERRNERFFSTSHSFCTFVFRNETFPLISVLKLIMLLYISRQQYLNQYKKLSV